MPWHNATTIDFSRIAIAAYVPADPGVFALRSGDRYLCLGDSWNLKAKLMEVANIVDDRPEPLSVVFETCEENERFQLRESLTSEFIGEVSMPSSLATLAIRAQL
jgi:hypothetical protein